MKHSVMQCGVVQSALYSCPTPCLWPCPRRRIVPAPTHRSVQCSVCSAVFAAQLNRAQIRPISDKLFWYFCFVFLFVMNCFGPLELINAFKTPCAHSVHTKCGPICLQALSGVVGNPTTPWVINFQECIPNSVLKVEQKQNQF